MSKTGNALNWLPVQIPHAPTSKNGVLLGAQYNTVESSGMFLTATWVVLDID